VVRQPEPVGRRDVFAAMSELEAACGRLAATRMTDRALAELAEARDACQSAIEAEDVAQYYDSNEIFHQLIYLGAANSFLEKQTRALQNRLRPYRKVQLRFRGRMAQSMAEHRVIVATLEAGDAEGAAQALRGHVAVQGEKFHQLLANLNS